MFAFVEHHGMEPTNNASERALIHYVVFRKVIGQAVGGVRAMRRRGSFQLRAVERGQERHAGGRHED